MVLSEEKGCFSHLVSLKEEVLVVLIIKFILMSGNAGQGKHCTKRPRHTCL